MRRTPRAIDPLAVRFEDDVFATPELAEVEGEPAEFRTARSASWLSIAVTAAVGLLSLGIGLWIEGLVSRLFALAPWAGFVALALALLLVVALTVLAIRELAALRRLRSRTALRERAAEAVRLRDDGIAREVTARLLDLFADRAGTAKGRDALQRAGGDIMNAEDRLRLADDALLSPLDRQAMQVVAGAAKRVSVVTAIAPRALIDIAFVVMQNARTIRAIAEIYGLRPGRLGFIRLARSVLGHLAVTGAIAVGDSVVGEAFGHTLASRLSSRFGEGVVNGLLTARVGIAAMDLCRPLPFREGARPSVGSVTRNLFGRGTDEKATAKLP